MAEADLTHQPAAAAALAPGETAAAAERTTTFAVAPAAGTIIPFAPHPIPPPATDLSVQTSVPNDVGEAQLLSGPASGSSGAGGRRPKPVDESTDQELLGQPLLKASRASTMSD